MDFQSDATADASTGSSRLDPLGRPAFLNHELQHVHIQSPKKSLDQSSGQVRLIVLLSNLFLNENEMPASEVDPVA